MISRGHLNQLLPLNQQEEEKQESQPTLTLNASMLKDEGGDQKNYDQVGHGLVEVSSIFNLNLNRLE